MTINSIDVTDNNDVLVNGLRGFAIIRPNGIVKEFGNSDNAVSVNNSIVDYEGNIWTTHDIERKECIYCVQVRMWHRIFIL